MRNTTRSAVIGAVVVVAALATGCTRENAPQANQPADPTSRASISVPAGSPSPLPVAATASPTNDKPLVVEINDVRADAHGLTVLRFTLVNTGSQPVKLERLLRDPNRGPAVGYDFFSCELAASGVTLVDPEAKERHHPLYRTDGEQRYCMNARWGGQRAGTTVEPGHSRILYATYILPEDVSSVTVEIPGFEPVENVPVTR